MISQIKKWLFAHTKLGNERYLKYLYAYDEKRFLVYSALHKESQEAIATEMRILVHTVEKAFSLPETQVGFGREKILHLIELLEKYQTADNPKDTQVIDYSYSIIQEYIKWQTAHGGDISFLPAKYLVCDSMICTGVIECCHNNADIHSFSDAAYARHSLRYYGTEKVSPEQYRQAVALAQTAPSACNRQSSRVYVCMDADKMRQIIQMHGGMRGFGEASAIVVLTGDLSLYTSEYERNTVFVDGGIFLMNLLYAFQEYDIAACPIIWGAIPENDNALYELLGIPQSEEIISLIVSGSFPEGEYKVAKSAKRSTDSILTIV